MKAAAIIVNFFIPGIGTLMVGKVTEGVIQFLLGFILVFILLLIPVLGWILAVFLGLGVRLWAIISAATAKIKGVS